MKATNVYNWLRFNICKAHSYYKSKNEKRNWLQFRSRRLFTSPVKFEF
jgi:hypothetical protein